MKQPFRSEKGQASILIGVMMMTFIIFFAFVVNVGTLVNAKINLQNAADLAAYAGAATQARQLNQISYLNYEMRRQYKKFLFRYYVIGNSAQATFPRTGANSASGVHAWSPNSNSGLDFQVPSVCIMFNSKDNYCQTYEMPGILFPTGSLDLINQTLVQQLSDLENLRQQNCGSLGRTNLIILRLWLYNTDPALQQLTTLGGSNDAQILPKVKGIAQGLGLVPKEILLRQRIHSLRDYINTPPGKGINLTQVNTLQSQSDPSQERTIQAFLSAYYTLGNEMFASQDISMDEILPSQLINLNDQLADFDTYSTLAELDGNPTGSIQISGRTPTPTACHLRLYPIISQGIPVGVTKDPAVLTYYAVKLTAKAKLLFYPSFFGSDNTIELKAYSAAQPFGSRIGPLSNDLDNWFSSVATPDQSHFSQDSDVLHIKSQLIGKIPNVLTRQDDPNGWNNDYVLAMMYSQMNVTNFLGDGQYARGFAAAMAPTLVETKKFNIPNDLPDPFYSAFNAAAPPTTPLTIWAPVLPPSEASQGLSAALQSELNTIFGKSTDPSANQAAQQFEKNILDAVTAYSTLLQAQNGENGEGMNITTIQNPLRMPDDGSAIHIPKITASQATEVKTSWNQINDGKLGQLGRVGYSVKFVSFDSLTSHKLPSDGTTLWQNAPTLSQDEGSDLSAIKH